MNNIIVAIATIVTMFLYGFIYSLIPEDFDFNSTVDPYYFSLTTMSTVGYGDFSPKTRRAKILVMSQQIILLTEILTFLSNILSSNQKKLNNNGVGKNTHQISKNSSANSNKKLPSD